MGILITRTDKEIIECVTFIEIFRRSKDVIVRSCVYRKRSLCIQGACQNRCDFLLLFRYTECDEQIRTKFLRKDFLY